MRRDRLTFAMMVGIPLMQLTLFGYAINTDPKHLPTVVLSYDQSDLTRSFVAALQNTGYYRVVAHRRQPRRRSTGCSTVGEVLFAVTIPAGLHARPDARRPARSSWSRATPPTRSPPAMPWAPWARCKSRALEHDLEGPAGQARREQARLRSARPPPLQPGRASPATTSCRAWSAPS